MDRHETVLLRLSFNPLLALRIAFREWETFFFGTARRNGGKSSRRDCKVGMDQVNPKGRGEVRKDGMAMDARIGR